MEKIIIRPAKPEDAEAVARIAHIGWLSTYVNDAIGITKEKMEFLLGDPMDKVGRNQEAIQNLSWETDAMWVAEEHGQPVGFVRPRIDEQQRHRVGAIYLLPEARGKGIGSLLIEKVKDFFKGNPIYLTVATYNDSAKEFYKHHGFEPTGKTELHEAKKNGSLIFAIPVIEMVYQPRYTCYQQTS